MGFALIFYGLNLMTGGLRPLRNLPEVMALVAWQLMVRMRSFRLGLAVNCENGIARILNLTAIASA
jgi:Na+/phosphate symporter